MKVLGNNLEIKKILYTEEQITTRIKEIGAQISKDYEGEELVVIGVIKGALYFFAEITQAIDLPIMIDMIGFGNIPDTTSKTGVVRITKDIDIDIKGKHVLIVEDVVRTGLTTAYLLSRLEEREPATINICTLLLNENRLLLGLPLKYVGFSIADDWLIGYGLDKGEIGRNLPYIATIEKNQH